METLPLGFKMIEIMNELVKEGMVVIKELYEEEIKPLIDYRIDLEKKISKKAIEELYKLEEEV